MSIAIPVVRIVTAAYTKLVHNWRPTYTYMRGSRQWYWGMGAFPRNIVAEWRAPKAEESRCRVGWGVPSPTTPWGLGRGHPSQPTRGSGKRCELPSGIRCGSPAGNAFRRILKAIQNAPLCTYMLMLWVRYTCVSCHIGGTRPRFGAIAPCPNVEPRLYTDIVAGVIISQRGWRLSVMSLKTNQISSSTFCLDVYASIQPAHRHHRQVERSHRRDDRQRWVRRQKLDIALIPRDFSYTLYIYIIVVATFLSPQLLQGRSRDCMTVRPGPDLGC